MRIEQLKEAATTEEMRAEIYRLRRHDPMVHKVMDIADYQGLSAEDRYVVLAYYALRERAMTQQMVLDNAMARPIPPLFVPSNS